MVNISIRYLGDLQCEATHGPSGKTLCTDAPKDNQGKGECFSPTDLVATALGTCIGTILGLQARTLGLSLNGMLIEVTKEMSVDPPRRIVRLPVVLHMPVGIEDKYRMVFVRAAATCPVHHSLHPDIESPMEFIWPD